MTLMCECAARNEVSRLPQKSHSIFEDSLRLKGKMKMRRRDKLRVLLN